MARGAWAESESARAREVAALRLGIELGMSLIDTAEMYGDGGAEEVVAEAIYGQKPRHFCCYESLSA
jgi:aryl-alcohol dehydrogenase-like predicted oxidoreductase